MWKTPTPENITRGTILFAVSLQNNGCVFSGHTVLKVSDEGKEVLLARPIAFASQHYDDSQPMLYAEVYSVPISKLCTDDWQVWVSKRYGVSSSTA